MIKQIINSRPTPHLANERELMATKKNTKYAALQTNYCNFTLTFVNHLPNAFKRYHRVQVQHYPG